MSNSFVNLPTLPDTASLGRQIAEEKNRLTGRYDAGEIFKYLVERVSHFQTDLSDEEEVGVKLANFGEAEKFMSVRLVSRTLTDRISRD